MKEFDEVKEAEKIAREYMPYQESKIDKLKKLNKKVKLPATIFAYTFGALGTLTPGSVCV